MKGKTATVEFVKVKDKPMGDATAKVDSSGREKAKCEICDKYYHRVDVHVVKIHKISVEAYSKKFPKAELMSAYAREKEEAEAAEAIEIAPTPGVEAVREEKSDATKPLRFGSASLYERTDLTAEEITKVPEHDEKWVIGATEHANLEALALGIEMNENVLIVGPPGVGKSTLARELASVCNQPITRLSFTGEVRVGDLMGGSRIIVDPASGQAITKYVDGPFPIAAEKGHWVIFEEFDSAPSQVTFALHSALERPRQLRLMEADREVEFHDKFRVIATANTLGYGDESGLYAGTAPMNEALLDRFGIVIKVDYPKKDDEVNILVERTGIKKNTAELMVDVASKVREAQKQDTTMTSISPRRLIMWAALTVKMGNPRVAAANTITNKIPPQDKVFVDGIVQRMFGAGK